MVDYKRFSFIIRIGFHLFTMSYLFSGDSEETNNSALIVSLVNLSVIFTDLGLIKDQLALNKGIRSLMQGLYQTWILTIIILLPLTLLSKIPLFLGGMLCSIGMIRNYQSKTGNHSNLFNVDIITSLAVMLLMLFDFHFRSLNFTYYQVVYLPVLIEFILYSRTIFRLTVKVETKTIVVSWQNYLSTIMDNAINNFDVLVVNRLFSSEVSQIYFQNKEVYKKSAQLSNLIILRLIYEKLKRFSGQNLLNIFLIFIFSIGLIEYTLNSTVFLTSIFLSVSLSLHASRLIKYFNLKRFNVIQLISASIMFVFLFFKFLDPIISFVGYLFIINIISNNLKYQSNENTIHHGS